MSDATDFPRFHVPRFALGRCLITPGALDAFARTHTEPITLLQRHAAGDWGEVDPEDAAANEHALRQGLRLLSVYRLPPDPAEPAGDTVTVWVITEADRRATTLLLPEEY